MSQVADAGCQHERTKSGIDNGNPWVGLERTATQSPRYAMRSNYRYRVKDATKKFSISLFVLFFFFLLVPRNEYPRPHLQIKAAAANGVLNYDL